MTSLPSRSALAAALLLALSAGTPVATAASASVVAAHPSIDAIDAARANPDVIILQTGIFDPAAQQLNVDAVGAAADAPSAYAIVQFRPGQLREQKALAARGVQFLGYVPNNAYYVRLNGATLEDLNRHPAVRWAGPLRPAMKLDPQLWRAERVASKALQEDGRYEIILNAFAGVSSADMAAALRKRVPNVEITLRSERVDAPPYVRASVQATDLDALLLAATQIDGVVSVAPWVPTTTNNAGGIAALQGNLTSACAGSGPVCGPAPLFDQGITGAGQIAAVADSGTTVNAAWFTMLDKGSGPHTEVTFAENPPPVLPNIGTLYPDNKIIGYWTQPGGPTDYDYVSGHGTHTTGTVVGDASGTFGANTFMPSTPLLPNHDLADGMAPNAQLLMQDIGPNQATTVIAADFAGTLEQAYRAGARVHNNSWGGPTAGQYSDQDAAADSAIRKREELLVVISAGNDNPGATQTGSPGNAKNAVTVAALGHAGSLVKASYSNAGPTADGRMKPDVAAPGSSVISARNSSTPVNSTPTAPQTAPNSGTSMAAPTVTGNAVLLREFFTDGFYPRGEKTSDDVLNPTGATLKALLLNGTTPATTPSAFPNTGTGWGRPWLDNSLWFKNTMPNGDDSRRLRLFERTNEAGMQTGDVHEYSIANVSAGIEFRATLTWFDPAAVPGSAATLINNLDLEVVAPDGQTYLGNRFSGGVSTTGGTADAKDTVEQVRFTAPVAGSYTLRVKATSVPGDGSVGSDRQGYALAVSGAFGLPDTAAFPAPTALAVAGNGSAGVAIGFTLGGGAQGAQLYRADGTCATAQAGDFHLVASGSGAPLTDTTTVGGFDYAYKVRGVSNDVEGDVSTCIDVVSQDECTLAPTFDVASVIADGANASCSVNLAWTPAESACPAAATITYKIERDTDPYFATAQTLEPAQSGTSFADTAVTNGTPYFYRVTATDADGNATVARIANATPTGADGPDPAAFLDDVDTGSFMRMQAPWQITHAAASNGSFSYRSAADGVPYPSNTCASIQTPPLTIAAGATGLSFKAKYDLELEWDGVTMEISSDGGATWNDLPPTGGYPSSFASTEDSTPGIPANACGYRATHGAFSGVTTASSNNNPGNGTATAVFKPFAADLSAYVGQTVQIRWVLATDPLATFDGFSLDEVRIGDGAASDVIFANGFDESAVGGDYMCH